MTEYVAHEGIHEIDKMELINKFDGRIFNQDDIITKGDSEEDAFWISHQTLKWLPAAPVQQSQSMSVGATFKTGSQKVQYNGYGRGVSDKKAKRNIKKLIQDKYPNRHEPLLTIPPEFIRPKN